MVERVVLWVAEEAQRPRFLDSSRYCVNQFENGGQVVGHVVAFTSEIRLPTGFGHEIQVWEVKTVDCLPSESISMLVCRANCLLAMPVKWNGLTVAH